MGLGLRLGGGEFRRKLPAAQKYDTAGPVYGLHFTRLGILWRMDWTDKKTGMSE